MKKFTRPDELIELLWQDGQVIMHKQTSQRSAEIDEPDRDHTSRCVRSYEKPNNLIQENDSASWFPCNVDDGLERDLCTEFFYGAASIDGNGLGYDAMEGEGCKNLRPSKDPSSCQDPSPKKPNSLLTKEPIKSQAIDTNAQICHVDTGGFTHSYCPQRDPRKESTHPNKKTMENPINQIRRDIKQTSSKISSNCGSNQFAIPPEPSQGLRNDSSSSREVTNTQIMSTRMQRHESSRTITSSSAGSGSSIGKAIDNNCNKDRQKRKQVDYEDTEFQSEDWDDCLVEPSNQLQRSTSTRRSRSAEVHNLSERRRRDRINEKLKALQGLIPNCSKTDKASVLDEAIEYLKSLQLQVQFMWMGSGMARMMLPNLQNYLLGLGMGMAHGSAMPTIPGSNQMPAVPMFNQHTPSPNPQEQARTGSFPSILPFDQPPQIQQNAELADVYGRFLGVQQMQHCPQSNPATGDSPL